MGQPWFKGRVYRLQPSVEGLSNKLGLSLVHYSISGEGNMKKTVFTSFTALIKNLDLENIARENNEYQFFTLVEKIQCISSKWRNSGNPKAMATHSSTLAWKIPWTEEPSGLQSMGSQRVRHDWATSLSHVGKGNGNPLQCSCLENPRDGGAWWAAFYGVAQSRTRLKRLSSSSSSSKGN